MKISARLSYGFGLVLLLITIVAGVGVSSVSNLARDMDEVVNDKIPKTIQANIIIDNVNVIALQT